MPSSESKWSIFIDKKQWIGPNTITPHYHIAKDTHQGKFQTRTWYNFLHLCQEYPSHIFIQDGNSNKGCYQPPGKYIGIFSVPDHPGYLLRRVPHPWTHPIWYDDLHAYSAYMCFFSIKEGSSVCPNLIFWTRAHHLCRLVYQNLQYLSLLTTIQLFIWLYYTLTEA